MKVPFQIVDVFSAAIFGGNPLAVVMDARGISEEGMQKIASEFNFAETTFVLPPADPGHTRRVRIFTPRAELQFAGHPTIGTACALAWTGRAGPVGTHEFVLEEGVGPVRVTVSQESAATTATLTLVRKVDVAEAAPDHQSLAQVLSVDPADVRASFCAGVGLRFCFVHVATPGTVDRATVDMMAWRSRLADAWSSNLYIFSGDLSDQGGIYARMFAPALGVTEDPATGSACAALVGFLASAGTSGKTSLAITQGVVMGRPSEIAAQASRGADGLISIRVGGAAAFVASGELEVTRRWLT